MTTPSESNRAKETFTDSNYSVLALQMKKKRLEIIREQFLRNTTAKESAVLTRMLRNEKNVNQMAQTERPIIERGSVLSSVVVSPRPFFPKKSSAKKLEKISEHFLARKIEIPESPITNSCFFNVGHTNDPKKLMKLNLERHSRRKSIEKSFKAKSIAGNLWESLENERKREEFEMNEDSRLKPEPISLTNRNHFSFISGKNHENFKSIENLPHLPKFPNDQEKSLCVFQPKETGLFSERKLKKKTTTIVPRSKLSDFSLNGLTVSAITSLPLLKRINGSQSSKKLSSLFREKSIFKSSAQFS